MAPCIVLENEIVKFKMSLKNNFGQVVVSDDTDDKVQFSQNA